MILIAVGLMATNNVFSTEFPPVGENRNVNELSSNEHIEMEKLTKDAFLKKVFNYEQNKEWKYEGELPCLIDFYADWCGPCRMLAPELERLAQATQGQLKIVKVNVDENPATPGQYGVRGIPAFIVFKDGQPVERETGIIPKSRMRSMLFD